MRSFLTTGLAGTLLAFLAVPCHGQGILGSSGLSGAGGVDILLQNAGVQRELKLTPQQVTRIKEVAHDVRTRQREALEKLKELSLEEQREKMRELLQLISRETAKGLKEVLQPDQSKRLGQIKLQNDGLRSMLEPEVENGLNLSEEQKEKLRDLADKTAEEMRFIRQGITQGNYQEVLGKLAAARKDALRDALGILTTQQRTIWKQLAGEPFEVKLERSQTRPTVPDERDRDKP